MDPDRWDALFPGDPEGWAFYRAVEEAGPPGFAWRYVLAEADGELVGAVPVFLTRYRLDTTVQGPMKRVGEALARLVPGLMSLRLAAMGSPVAEGCHLGVAAHWRGPERERVATALVDGFEALAAGEGCRLLAVKDATAHDDASWRGVLAPRGYQRLAGLPTGVLDLPPGGLDGYLKSLSRATRKDVKRKLRDSAVSVEVRDDIADVVDEVGALYDQTVAHSAMQFEHLPANYFDAVLRHVSGARIVLYRHGGRIVAFNLVIEGRGRLIDKYIGMDYAVARDLNLYVVSWMRNVQDCIDRGLPVYQSGQAFYGPKLRLGCHLSANWLFFRHANPLLNLVLRGVARLVRLDRFDPEIARLVEDSR